MWEVEEKLGLKYMKPGVGGKVLQLPEGRDADGGFSCHPGLVKPKVSLLGIYSRML